MKAVWYPVSRILQFLLFCVVMQQTAVAQLHTDFTANPSGGCAPVFVHFTDKSTGGATSWKWDLGNGTTSFLQNPSTTYFNPGKYSIKLIIRNGSQADSLVKVNYITINALPKPGFIASDSAGCYPLTVNFSDLSNAQEGSIIKWEWDLGDGSVSTLQNPSHTYTSAGNYNVILRVTNTAGCVSTVSKAQYIKIKDGVQADFSYTGSSQCTPPSIIHFTNKSTGTGLLSYQWAFGDGNTSVAQDPANTYNGAGLYSIQLIVRNNAGCVDTLIKKDSIAVGVAKADFTAPDSICPNTSFQLFNTSKPASGNLQWNFGDGNLSNAANPTILYSNPGTYRISMIADFGSCKDSTFKFIKVLPKAIANFSANKTASCGAPLTVQFNSLSAGAVGYKWSFGDNTTSVLPNPSHTYTQNGNYDVTLVVTNASGCSDTLTKSTYIIIQPAEVQINGLPLTGCAPGVFSPSYTIKSTIPVTGFLWNFGDGATSALPKPTHVYNLPGVYTVTLDYTTADGCTGTLVYTDAVRLGQKPSTGFTGTPNDACAMTPIIFSDLSTGTITNWLWNFGDGTTDTARNPVHLYNDTGYFNIQLIISNNGCSDTLAKPKFIHINPPIARFSVMVNCDKPYHFEFTDYSIAANSWAWDFGDGTTSAAQNPVHDYATPGNYTVKLTVTNGICMHTAAYKARIIDEKADFVASRTVVCRGDSILLQPVGINPANIYAYKWIYSYGTDTSRNIKLAFDKSGKYTVGLIITNINGCTDTMTKVDYIIVNGPTADFGAISNAACLNKGGNIQFSDLSASDGTHAITNWVWSFGDGNNQIYNAGPFSHSYVTAGHFNVSLKVTDAIGCIDSVTKPNQIYIADPKAAFTTPDSMSCQNKPVSFINQSQGQGLAYMWSFSDATSSSDQDPVHNFTAVGIYDAGLKITDMFGCSDSTFKPLFIHIDEPKAKFAVSDSASTCPPLVVSFTNQSKYYKQLSWDFGDGTGALVENPQHYYNYPGVYYARLIVVSPGGCTDTVYKKIEIKGPTGVFVYDKTTACNPGTVAFNAVTQNTKSFIWDYNDGATDYTIDSFSSHKYVSLGEYIPKMILEDDKGCKVPIVGKDTIRIYGVNASFTSDKNVLCDKGVVNFTDASVSNDLITAYDWLTGDGGVMNGQTPSHTYTTTGIFPVKLVVTTLNGCKDSSGQVTNIKVAASPQVSILGDSSACAPALISFAGQIDVADSSQFVWQWGFSNNSAAPSVQNPAPVSYQQAGSYVVTMSATNSLGCTTTKTKPVVIHPVPNVNAGNNTAVCEKKTATLEATGADTYAWSPAKAISCTNCATPIVSPDSTIMYYVEGATVFGCKASDSVLISVKHPFSMRVGPGDTLCKGESYHLLAQNAELYDWTPSVGLDNNHIRTPKAIPSQTTQYQVIGRDSVGCFYDTAYVSLVVYPIPSVNAGLDKTLSVGSSIELDGKISEDVKTIQWQPAAGLSCTNCLAPVANPKQTTTYRLMAINEGGCVNKDEVTIFVVCNNGNIFLPNTFSPNGNGTNDVFYPRGTGLYNIRSLHIFNRWGESVFEASNFRANDPSKGWNGTFKNKPAPNDVYVYYVEVICENNAVIMYSGNIAIVR